MKRLVLFVLVALIFPLNADAFHCKGSHADEPGCDSSPTNSGPAMMVDADGQVVGIITDLNHDFADIVIRLDSGPVLAIATSEYLADIDTGSRTDTRWTTAAT